MGPPTCRAMSVLRMPSTGPAGSSSSMAIAILRWQGALLTRMPSIVPNRGISQNTGQGHRVEPTRVTMGQGEGGGEERWSRRGGRMPGVWPRRGKLRRYLLIFDSVTTPLYSRLLQSTRSHLRSCLRWTTPGSGGQQAQARAPMPTVPIPVLSRNPSQSGGMALGKMTRATSQFSLTTSTPSGQARRISRTGLMFSPLWQKSKVEVC